MALVLVCLSVTAVLAERYRGQSHGGWLDTTTGAHIRAIFGGHPWFLKLLLLGDPVAVAGMAALLCLGCLSQRRRRAALLVAIAVPAAGAVTELLLKPLIHRTFFGGLAFPSGHATGAFSIAVVVAVLLVDPPSPRLPASRRMLLAGAALGGAVAVCTAVLGANNHYPTDVVGGATMATAVVLLTALLLDLLPTRPFRRPGATPRRPPT